MPNNKRNISFKKKNKRGGRGGSSFGVNVQKQIPGVYRASSLKGNNTTFYKISNNGHIVSEITNTDIKQIEQTIDKEKRKKKAEQMRIKKAAKKIQEIYKKHLNEPSEKFYREILDKFKKDITSHFKAIEILFETLGVSYDEDKYTFENDYKVILADHKKEIKKKYIERYSNDQELRAKTGTKTDATELIKKINESIKKIENEHLDNFRRKMEEEEQQLERKKKLEERKKRLEERKKRIEDFKKLFKNMVRWRGQQQRRVSEEEAATDSGNETDNMSKNNSESNSNSESNNNEYNNNEYNNNNKPQTVKNALDRKFKMRYVPRPKNRLPMKQPRSAEVKTTGKKRLLDVLEQNPTPKPNPLDKKNSALPGIQPGQGVQPKEQQNHLANNDDTLLKNLFKDRYYIYRILKTENTINKAQKTQIIKFFSSKKFIDSTDPMTTGRMTNEIFKEESGTGLKALAKKLLTKGPHGEELVKRYYPINYESQLGGSRKPTKKQKRKGKLPKHLRNTRRRKSYHKKRQLKTKNTRTRKFKK